MAAYPLPSVVRQSLGSRFEADEGTVMDRAESGKPRFRRQFTQIWGPFRVVHDDITTAQRDLVHTHYAGDKNNAFSFTWAGDGASYNVRYSAAPVEIPVEGNAYWRVEVQLERV